MSNFVKKRNLIYARWFLCIHDFFFQSELQFSTIYISCFEMKKVSTKTENVKKENFSKKEVRHFYHGKICAFKNI